MAYIYIYDVYSKFSQHYISGKQMAARHSQCAEISWIRTCLEVCQLLPPICYKKGCRSKRNQLTHQRSFEPGPGDEATSQSCFESMGKKTWKKTTASVWSIQKWWLLFTSKNSILKKPSLIKKKKRWLKYPPPWKPPTPAWDTTIQMSWRVAMRR